MPEIVALTGATGFIGGAIARCLQLAGWQLRALVRTPQKATGLQAAGIEIISGSLQDEDSLRRLLTNAVAVVHCAGAVRGASAAAFTECNVAGSARLARLAAAQPTKPRFLLLSSLAAREPQLSWYAASKFESEQVVAEALGEHSWTALRPPAVYGPGDREMLPVWHWLGRGLAPLPAPPQARLSLLYVDDLARAVQQWLSRADCAGVFELHDGRPRGYSWDDIIAIVSQLRRRRILRLPVYGLDAIAWLNLHCARRFGYAPMLTPGKLCEIRHPDWVCDNRRWQQASAWVPIVSLADGLSYTVGWDMTASSQTIERI